MRLIIGTRRRKLAEPLGREDEEQDALETWIDYMKRTAKIVEDQLNAAGISDWLTAWKERKKRFADKLEGASQEKWSKILLQWNPQRHSHRPVRRAQGRQKKRWQAEI